MQKKLQATKEFVDRKWYLNSLFVVLLVCLWQMWQWLWPWGWVWRLEWGPIWTFFGNWSGEWRWQSSWWMEEFSWRGIWWSGYVLAGWYLIQAYLKVRRASKPVESCSSDWREVSQDVEGFFWQIRKLLSRVTLCLWMLVPVFVYGYEAGYGARH
jgi:hypothetical protein